MGDVVMHRGIAIRTFDVPCTPFVWTDDRTGAADLAETLEQARQQIDAAISGRGIYRGWTLFRLHGGGFEARGRATISGSLRSILDQIDAMEVREPEEWTV